MKWTWIRMIHINSRIEDWFAGDFGVSTRYLNYGMKFAMADVVPHSFYCILLECKWSAPGPISIFEKWNHHLSNIFESAPEHWIFYLWVLVWWSCCYCCDANIENVWSVSECWSLMLPECTKFWLTVPTLIPFHLSFCSISLAFAALRRSLSILGIVKYHSDVYHIF